MSFVPAASDPDLLAVLGAMAVAVLAVGMAARRNGKDAGTGPDPEAPANDEAAGDEAR